MRVHDSPHLATAGKMLFVHSSREVQIADLETAIRRISAQAKGTVGRTEETRPSESVGLAGNADIRRKVVPRAKLMRDDAPNAGILHRRAWTPAGEHIMRAPIMI